jgi:hypothetical protein
MPAGPARGIVLGMTETGSGMFRVELDLVPDAEPIQGHARGVDGVEHTFAGWLELVEVLDRARVSRPPGSPETPAAMEKESP